MSNNMSTQCLNIPTYALLMAKLRHAVSGIRSIRYVRPDLIFEMNDGSEIRVTLPEFQQWFNVTQADFDLLTPNMSIKDNYYVVDNSLIYYCDGTQFIPISTSVKSLTTAEEDNIIKRCVGDYYASTSTRLTESDLTPIVSENNRMTNSELENFMNGIYS